MMKKIIYTLMALVMIVGGMESSAQTVSGQVAGHDYVDLGLPSGTKWATCNVGATKPTENGDYFAWGETKPKVDYSWRNYKWTTDGGNSFTKYSYIVDNKTILEPTDDAATANWGEAWRMPTLDEIKELLDGCKWEWVKDFNGSGLKGRLGTSTANGNTIFLSAAGYRFGTALNDAGKYGYYRSSSLFERNSYAAYGLGFEDGYVDWGSELRIRGLGVRAVTK